MKLKPGDVVRVEGRILRVHIDGELELECGLHLAPCDPTAVRRGGKWVRIAGRGV